MKKHPLVLALSLLSILAFLIVFTRVAWQAKELPRSSVILPQVVVLTYESFAATMGPGPELIRSFESSCQCKVQLISASDAGLLLEKLRLATANLKVDVVIGLDQLLLKAAREKFKWRSLSHLNVAWDEKIKSWVTPDFIPFDWAPLTLIYRPSEIDPPRDPKDLLSSRFQSGLAIQDPRTSSPGLQFLFALSQWAIPAPLPEFLKAFKVNVHSVSPTWSTAYGLFQRKQAKMVVSYVTSLVYHWTVEKNEDYQAVRFQAGHPMQVEYMGLNEGCGQCELGEKFIRHILQFESQRVIMQKNFMYPVLQNVKATTAFDQLPEVPLLEASLQERFEMALPGILGIWQKSMR